MKIVRRGKKREEIYFFNLADGQVFEYSNVLWLKCYDAEQEKDIAVNLVNYAIEDFHDEIVEIVDCELHILD